MSEPNVPETVAGPACPYLPLTLPPEAQALGSLLPRRTDDPRHLTLDMVYVVLPDGTVIDVDWLPEHDPAGRFRVVVFSGNWNNQVEAARFTPDPEAARAIVEGIAARRCDLWRGATGRGVVVTTTGRGVVTPATTVQLSEEAFHRSRQMFAVRHGTVLLAPPGSADSHAEWLYGLLGADAGRAAYATWVRGYALGDGVVAYIGEDFSHRMDLGDAAAAVRLFVNLRAGTGARLEWVGLGAVPGTGQPWQPRVRMTVEKFLVKTARKAADAGAGC